MEFKDKDVDNLYSDLRAEEEQLEDDLDRVRRQIQFLIDNNETE